MKISEVTLAIVKDYCRVSDDESNTVLDAILTASKSYIKGYTGLTDEQLEAHEDITIALLVLCSDMYDNRQTTVQNANENKVVSTILGMHATNYL